MNVDYGNNPNQRTPCVLVLDASGSMNEASPTGRRRIEELNQGLRLLEQELRADPAALSRVQLAIVCVGGPAGSAEVMMDWTDVSNFSAFEITADGATPLGGGVQLGLDLVEQAKIALRAAGISYTRPWMIVMSDGEPTDGAVWTASVKACRAAEAASKVEVFAIGVAGANLATLGQISAKPALMLSGVKFRELFEWLSDSLSAASRSRPGEALQLPSTDPWRNVGI